MNIRNSIQLKRMGYTILAILLLTSFNTFDPEDTVTVNDSVDPNYTIVFPQNRVNRIDITINPQDWKKLTSNLVALYGKPGDGKSRGPAFMPGPHPDSLPSHPALLRGQPPLGFRAGNFSSRAGDFRPPDFSPPVMPGNGKGRPNNSKKDSKTEYVPCTIAFENGKWSNVGFRFKGNSSLMMSWGQGIKKLPFRLDFNRFAKQVPSDKNQTFYGFTELSFSGNNNDPSFLREKVTADIFRLAGVKAPQTAFYRVYINYGEGAKYFGLYTLVEIVEDTMIKTQFADGSGNCYKPEGPAASFTGTFNRKSFEKKTNKKRGRDGKADWNDVEKLFTILNDDARLSTPPQWRAELESILDVPAFIRWLAVNTTIQNWDTYGAMAHNYYLYNDPTTKKLVWIPWDNNEAMSGKGHGLSLSLKEIGHEWPLIRCLLDQPTYYNMYRQEVERFTENVFTPMRMHDLIFRYVELIKPYVIGMDGEQKDYTYLGSPDDFARAVEALEKHIEGRFQLAQKFVKTNG